MRTIEKGGAGEPVYIPQITPKDVAALGNFSYHGIVREIHRGRLKAHKMCGQWRMYARDIEAWIELSIAPGADARAEPDVPSTRPPKPKRGSIAALRALEQQRQRPAA